MDQRGGGIGEANAQNGSTDAQEQGLGQDDAEDEGLGRTEALQYADLPSPLQYGHIHGKRDDQEADDHADPHDHHDEPGQRGNVIHIQQRDKVLHGKDGDFLTQQTVELLDHRFDLFWGVHFYESLADMFRMVVALLEGLERNHDVGQFAALHDARDMPLGLQQIDCVTHFGLGLIGVEFEKRSEEHTSE